MFDNILYPESNEFPKSGFHIYYRYRYIPFHINVLTVLYYTHSVFTTLFMLRQAQHRCFDRLSTGASTGSAQVLRQAQHKLILRRGYGMASSLNLKLISYSKLNCVSLLIKVR
jgi:hypothetical protein